MQPAELRNLERVLNAHGSDVSTIYCVITALIQQLKETQGEEVVEAAFKKAMANASGPRPMNSAAPSGGNIRRLFGKT
ncbi:hypothetical protein [Pseudomonas chlororaphis]|uniref:hypothetical protein n=1 Tax=Pseudomonas chlororaphis TaxID=587753 RepID=UPI0012DAB9F0|nr:hypothetical protein [Pseudomonas chlororaphis]